MDSREDKLYSSLNIAQAVDMLLLAIYVGFSLYNIQTLKDSLASLVGVIFIGMLFFIASENIKHSLEDKQYKKMLSDYVKEKEEV